MRCDDAAILISLGMDKKLGPWAKARLRLHLRRCVQCRNLAYSYAFLRRSGQGITNPPD